MSMVFISKADVAVSKGKTDCAPGSPGRRLPEVLEPTGSGLTQSSRDPQAFLFPLQPGAAFPSAGTISNASRGSEKGEGPDRIGQTWTELDRSQET